MRQLSLNSETDLSRKKLLSRIFEEVKSYRKRNPKLGKYIGIPERVDIEERPDVVNNRGRLGDWETDTMIGKLCQTLPLMGERTK